MRSIILCTMALMICSASARGADPSAPDADEVARLKARVSGLEGQVRDLKQQLEARQAVPAIPDGPVQPYTLRVIPKAPIHPDARPFEFNGRTYYIMPLSTAE